VRFFELNVVWFGIGNNTPGVHVSIPWTVLLTGRDDNFGTHGRQGSSCGASVEVDRLVEPRTFGSARARGCQVMRDEEYM